MDSFQAKIGWKRIRLRENKNYCSVPFPPDANIKLKNKQQKNSKKLKNTIMDSFQAKIGWKWMKKRENRNYRSIPFKPEA